MEHKIITDLAYTYIGLVTTMTKHYVDEGVPLLFNSSIRAEGIDFSNPIYLDNEFAEDNKNRKHRTGDVITVHTGDIGTSAIIPDSLDGSLGFATIVTRIHDKNVLLPEYLCAYLNYGGGKEQLYKYARDIRNNLNLKDFNKLIVPVPDLYRQKEIVKNVNTLNKTVCQRKQELVFFDDLIKARFVELFGDPVHNPMRWPVKRLGDLSVQINSGNTPKGGEQVYVDKGITFFRSQNVWKDRLEMDDIAYIDEKTHASMSRSSLKHGDILMTKTGRINTENSSLGRAALYMGEDDAANVNGHVYFIRLKPGVNNKFILRILVSNEYRDHIRSVCVGGIDKRQLNKDHIEDFPIICPPEDMINEYIKVVEQIDKSKVVVQRSLDETQKLFDSLMQEYFG